MLLHLSPASLPRRMTFLLEWTGWEDVEASGDVRIQTGWEVGWTSTSKSIFIDLVVKSERRWRPGIQGRFQKEFLEDSLWISGREWPDLLGTIWVHKRMDCGVCPMRSISCWEVRQMRYKQNAWILGIHLSNLQMLQEEIRISPWKQTTL